MDRYDDRVFGSHQSPTKIGLIREAPKSDNQHLYNGNQATSTFVVTQRTYQTSTLNDSQHEPTTTAASSMQQNYSTNLSSPADCNRPYHSASSHRRSSRRTNYFDQLPSQRPQQNINLQHQQQNSALYQASSQPAQRLTPTENYVQHLQQHEAAEAHNRSLAEHSAARLAAELADKEAKLMVKIENLQRRPYSPYQSPAKIDLTSEHRIAQQQLMNAPSPRPLSQASSSRSTSADLLDKEAKLMQEIEEIERKPYNPQVMIVEREQQWFDFPSDTLESRVSDVAPPSRCYSANSSLCSSTLNSRRSPRREVDNKSPLPFAFDNFTTKGVRGNIASACAVEPERPRPPIYPIVKRSPSPFVTAALPLPN